ncbi:MAG: hypothetical protein QXF26_04045 [Candidatus Bathyarchaeia archaeon]
MATKLEVVGSEVIASILISENLLMRSLRAPTVGVDKSLENLQ